MTMLAWTEGDEEAVGDNRGDLSVRRRGRTQA